MESLVGPQAPIEAISAGVAAVQEAYAHGGWLMAAAALLTVSIRVYRHPDLQHLLPERARWETWGAASKAGFVVGSSFVGAAGTALLGGMGWQAALLAAVPVALGSMFANAATKGLGVVTTAAALKSDPDYIPSTMRDVVSLLVPLDHTQIKPELRR